MGQTMCSLVVRLQWGGTNRQREHKNEAAGWLSSCLAGHCCWHGASLRTGATCCLRGRVSSAGGGPSMVSEMISSPRSRSMPSTRRSSRYTRCICVGQRAGCEASVSTGAGSSNRSREEQRQRMQHALCAQTSTPESSSTYVFIALALLWWQLAKLLCITQHQVHVPVVRHKATANLSPIIQRHAHA